MTISFSIRYLRWTRRNTKSKQTFLIIHTTVSSGLKTQNQKSTILAFHQTSHFESQHFSIKLSSTLSLKYSHTNHTAHGKDCIKDKDLLFYEILSLAAQLIHTDSSRIIYFAHPFNCTALVYSITSKITRKLAQQCQN